MSRTVWPAPDRSRLVETGSARIYVTDVGPADAETTVLVHDVLRCGHSFAALLEHVDATRRWIAVDLPGCGESDRPEPAPNRIEWSAEIVAETLVRMGVDRYAVVGAGFGALVGMALAAVRPHAVTRLVGLGVPRGDGQYVHEMRLASLPGIGHLAFARAYRRADLERTIGRSFAEPHRPDPVTLDVYWDRLGREGGIAAARDMLMQLERAPAVGDAFGASGVPALLLWGDRDPVGPADRTRWTEVLPGVSTMVVDACGQAVAEDRPDLLAAVLDGGGV
jgi:pimeloyl-ACP methyl ester carboxylesterase